MSFYDYRYSAKLAVEDPPFYALIMAAMRGADDSNLAKLMLAWPNVWKELNQRYNAPGGLLPGETDPTLSSPDPPEDES